MTNEELDKAIDTAAKHSSYRFNDGDLFKMMRDHLAQLLAIQLERAKKEQTT